MADLQMKEWVIQNMFAIENDTLSERQRKSFMDLIEDRSPGWRQRSPFILECFDEFVKRGGALGSRFNRPVLPYLKQLEYAVYFKELNKYLNSST